MRSRSGPGIVSSVLAVVTKIVLERSNVRPSRIFPGVTSPLRDVGNDLCELRPSVRAVAFGEHPHWRVVFPDAVDAAGEMIFGAERGLEKPFDDLTVGEDLLLGALALCDGGDFSQGEHRPGVAVSPVHLPAPTGAVPGAEPAAEGGQAPHQPLAQRPGHDIDQAQQDLANS